MAVSLVSSLWQFEFSSSKKKSLQRLWLILIDFWCFYATFSNISAISWRPVLVVEEAGSTRREPPTMGKQLINFITCGCESSALYFLNNLQSRARTHAVLVIDLYESLGNPTTITTLRWITTMKPLFLSFNIVSYKLWYQVYYLI